MKRLSLVALALITACAPGQLFRHGPTANKAIEAQYQRALSSLGENDSTASLDTAITNLDAYLAYTGYVQHRAEATALRRLALDAQQLARVQAALKEARANVPERRSGDLAAGRPDDEAVKEIQRLREELAKANAELERIKKRLATPKP